VYSKKYSVKSGTQETGIFLPWGVPEFEMFYSFCFPVVFQLPGNGSGGGRIQRITRERTQRLQVGRVKEL
jgi:hypothetical protein